MTKKLNWLSVVLFLLLIAPPMYLSASTVEVAKTPHKIPEVKSSVKIDGVLEEKEWEGALFFNLNYEIDPGDNIAPPVKTEVYLLYNEKNLYVGFKAYDPKINEIRARVTDRDNITIDDHVGIVLDTFNDSRLTHEFWVNPLGIQMDNISTLSQGASEWDAIWNSAGRITKDGYFVEMAIPFTSLRFQGKKGEQIWGIDAVRYYPRSVAHTIGLFARDRNNNCYMCQSEKLEGFSGAKPGRNLEFDPTLVGIIAQERESFPDGKYIDLKKKIEPGLTARWSVTPNLTLNAAVNPDFSQVEADDAQLDINTQFALFYPERRPFFTEGMNIFESRFFPVYTRSVADPEWGIKLTGKEKKHTIAFFSARDKVTNLIIPSSENSSYISLVDPKGESVKNFSTALRYRQDVGKASNFGFFVTDREGGEKYFNRLVGVDAEIRPNRRNLVAFQYLATQTRYPEYVSKYYGQPYGKFNGGAFDGIYTYTTRSVIFNAHYQDVSPNYRSDVGFADQTGTRLYEVSGRYLWRKRPGFWYTRIAVTSAFSYMTDYDSELLNKTLQTTVTYNGPSQSYVAMQYTFGKFSYYGNRFDRSMFVLNSQFRPSGSVLVGFQSSYGKALDVANVRLGDRLRFNPFIQYNIGRHLYVGGDHLFERFKVDGGRLYTANLTNLRIVYQFNRRAFLRAIIQYANYDYNTKLYSTPRDPEYKHVFSQILFSYKINPQTVLFLGYSDDYYGFSTIPLKQNNRTFFMKIGYALVL